MYTFEFHLFPFVSICIYLCLPRCRAESRPSGAYESAAGSVRARAAPGGTAARSARVSWVTRGGGTLRSATGGYKGWGG